MEGTIITTPEQFAYWLQGFVENNNGTMPTEDQWKMIVQHLQTIFTKITPELGDDKVQQTQADFDNETIERIEELVKRLERDEIMDRLKEGLDDKEDESLLDQIKKGMRQNPPPFGGGIIPNDLDTKTYC